MKNSNFNFTEGNSDLGMLESLTTKMNRNRSAGIVIKDNKILVMHRIKNGEEYWVFPGGGQEKGETPDQAAMREIDEETTVKVALGRLIYHIAWDTGEEYFFYLCEYISGEPHLREDSEEYELAKNGDQVYEPIWVNIDKLPELKLYQLEVRDLLMNDCKNGFPTETQELFIKFAERRHG